MLDTRSWSTADIPPGLRAKFWLDACCEAFFEMNVDIDATTNLNGRIVQRDLGPIQRTELSLEFAQSVQRTARSISRSDRAQVECVTVRRGICFVQQQGHDVELGVGDSILIDNRQPFKLVTSMGCQTVATQLPVSWLELWLPSISDVCARPIGAQSAWGPVIRSIVEAAPDREGHPAILKLYADQLAGALAIALDRPLTSAAPSNKLFARAVEALRAHAQDCELDAATLASMLGISVRYMHKIFAGKGTTYSATLLAERLGLAARMLSDPRFADIPTTEIGWRSGFADPSHFYRRFRRQFGEPPGRYRAQSAEHL